ncbi:hypothetical protein SASPL_108281 [Salvia splendens]|uniref:DUF7906 domain-containing protein n=1 Tax=Salvia splendens TaxID=180675 RepID=A0A8X8YEG9_SALSN|nr:hypothetical protein SASPL_108281 [Salvia splendens]
MVVPANVRSSSSDFGECIATIISPRERKKIGGGGAELVELIADEFDGGRQETEMSLDSLVMEERRGLSESEINFLKENKTLQTKIRQSGNIPESVLALEKIKRPLYEKHPMAKFSWTIMEETDTIDWYNRFLDTLNNVERLYQGKDTAHMIQSKVLQFLEGKNEKFKPFTKKDLESGNLDGFHAECLTDTWIGNQRWAFIDLSAGPFSWGPSVGGEGVGTEQSLPNVEKTIGAVADTVRGRKIKLSLCEELDERMHDLKNELQSFEGEEYDESHKTKAIHALKRMENWNLFSDTHEEFQNYTVARDTFLSHLGATLWGSLRHIISPSLADGAFHYYEKISFQLFFVTQEKVRHIKQLPVDLENLVHGLSSLVLPSQQVHFSQHMKTLRTYLDSSILQHQLLRLHGHASLKGLHAQSRSTLEIPIFWFIHNEDLLVGKHYQARALSGMVVVVQSEPSSWESHLQCNGQSLLWDLRRPTKAALAAVSEHLAGVLPLHLVYSQVHETAIELGHGLRI